MSVIELNERIKNVQIPNRMRKLPIDDRGFPIPKFVPFVNGSPEFRAMDGKHLIECVKRKLCWLCGEPTGVHMTFVMGPMCAINVNNAEPPCHYRCAEYAVKTCPFLTQPRMRRNEKDTPWGDEPACAGIALKRNPGVALLWTTRTYRIEHSGGGLLFRPGQPEHIEAYCEGRAATWDEIKHSLDTGIPSLLGLAREEGEEAAAECYRMIAKGVDLLRSHLVKGS